MALQSVSPVTHLLPSNSRSPTQPSSLRNGLFFVDFVGLYCKSKRTRRKFGASISRTLPQLVPNSRSSVKAVLDLQRTNISSDESPAHPDFKPQVWFLFADTVFLFLNSLNTIVIQGRCFFKTNSTFLKKH